MPGKTRLAASSIAVLAVALVGGGAALSPLLASNPPDSSVAVPASAGQTATATWTGTIPAGSLHPTSDCTDGTNTDSHSIAFTVPSGLYNTVTATFAFSITWTPNNPLADVQANDEILTVFGPDGSAIESADTANTTEKVTLTNLAAGTYKAVACGYLNQTDQPYTGTIKVTTALKNSAEATNPNTRDDNQLTFTDATVVDPILFGGEPGINIDPTSDGSRVFADWPVSSRVNIGVLFRSDDGGLTFRKRYADAADSANAGFACLGRQVPMCASGGGGDTDVNINRGNGNVYFASQESLAGQAVAASFDHGTSFPTDHVDPVASLPCAPVDRQWLASLKNTNDVFLAFHIPILAECVSHSSTAGTTGSWQPPAVAFPNVTQSGSMEADNTGGVHDKTLYITYIASLLNGLADAGTFHVAVSTDKGASWTDHKINGATSVRSFDKLQIDTAGNLYATWVDSDTQHTWLSTSLAADPANVSAPGTKWSKPVQVEGGHLHVTIFPDVVAGSPGHAAIAYYGTTAAGPTPDDVQPGQGGWSPYVATTDNALCQWDATPCASPSFHQSVISHRPNHDDNICTSGTTCVVLPTPTHPGNRNLLDYFDISLDPDGHLGFIWGDTRNGTGFPFVKVSRQATGPSLYTGKPNAVVAKRLNGQGDKAGDALYPIASTKVLTAPNHPGQDLLGTTIELKDPTTIEVRMKVADTSKLGDMPTGMDDLTPLQQTKYVTRWDFNKSSYYVGAAVAAGSTTPTYFAGEVSNGEGLTNPGSTTPFGNIYSPLVTAGVTGRVENGTIAVDVPTSAVGSPTLLAALYSVGSYSMIGPTDQQALLLTAPITLDATPTFDTALSGPAAAAILNPGGGASGGGTKAPLPATGGDPAGTMAGLGAASAAVALLRLRRRTRRAP